MTKQISLLLLFFLVLSWEEVHGMGIKIPISSEKKISCDRAAGSRPFPDRPAGSKNPNIPLNHLVVIMQENRSFDHYFGKLNKAQFYGKYVDGVEDSYYNTDFTYKRYYSHHANTLCLKSPNHDYFFMHMAWNKGMMDSFVRYPAMGGVDFQNLKGINPGYVMAYYDETDIPFYYSLANNFAIADKYFASGLTGTHPNRLFLLSGTARGEVDNLGRNFTWKTIFEVLNEHKISWKYYRDGEGYLFLFKSFYEKNSDKIGSIIDYREDLRTNNLPTVVFLDAPWDTTDEHPGGGNFQKGVVWAGNNIAALMVSESWKSSALFLTYDEGGAYYDHVPPPPACLPDGYKNKGINPLWQPDRLGFRVPFVAVSPYTKRHYVSHLTYDHTSVLKFIETWWNLPALSKRDANANDLLDLFNFNKPKFDNPIPYLKKPVIDPARACSPPP